MSKTKATSPGAPARTRRPAVPAELKRRIAAALPGWRVVKGELHARWPFPDFANALGAAVRVGALAEQAGHHPDLAVGWGYLEVRLSSHEEGGITEKDVTLAERFQKGLGRPS